jgi:tetratricopeptide (TPR) repeat protein
MESLGVKSAIIVPILDCPLKNVFAIVTLSALLAAAVAAEPEPRQEAPGQAAQAEPPLDGDALPNVPLSSDMLYKLMKAELEFKAGQWQGPYVTMMGTAQLTRDPRLAKRAVDMALAAKQPRESMAAVRLWRDLAPRSDEAAQYFLGFVILSDDFTEAEPIFARRLEDASPARRGVAIFQIQQFLSRAKDKAKADAMLTRLLQPYQGLLETRLVQAQTAHARGNNALALAEARAAMAQKPDSELAILTLAQVTGDEAEVVKLLTTFLDAHPGAREVRAARARLYVNQKQYDQARGEFLTLLSSQPDNLGTLYALGIMSMQLNDAPGAEKYFTRFMDVLADHPNDERDPTKVLMILSQLAEERHDYKAALQWLERIEPIDTRSFFSAQLKRAQLTGKQGDLDAARKLLDDIKTGEPQDDAQIVLAHAQILRDADQLEAAYAVMQAGAQRFPNNTDVLYDFALLAEKTGRLDVMEVALRVVISQAPDSHHAYNALGYSLAERNVRLPEALELIEKANKMAPDDPFIMDSLGWVHYRMGKLDLAEQWLRRAHALRGDAEIAVHLGEVLWHRGQKAEAQKLWRDVRSKDPKNDALKSTLARLNPSL